MQRCCCDDKLTRRYLGAARGNDFGPRRTVVVEHQIETGSLRKTRELQGKAAAYCALGSSSVLFALGITLPIAQRPNLLDFLT